MPIWIVEKRVSVARFLAQGCARARAHVVAFAVACNTNNSGFAPGAEYQRSATTIDCFGISCDAPANVCCLNLNGPSCQAPLTCRNELSCLSDNDCRGTIGDASARGSCCFYAVELPSTDPFDAGGGNFTGAETQCAYQPDGGCRRPCELGTTFCLCEPVSIDGVPAAFGVCE